MSICLSWADPDINVLVFYRVFYRRTIDTSLPYLEVDTFFTSVKIDNLIASTSYDFWLVGYTNLGVESYASVVAVFSTGVSRPKQTLTKDINNIVCVQVKNPTTFRNNVKCTWTNAAPNLPIALRASIRCVSPIRKTRFLRKNYVSTKAPIPTTITWQVNRDVATCSVYLKAKFGFLMGKRQPGVRHNLIVILG